MFLQVYNVTGEAQVWAAAKFLRGAAEDWWQGLQATGRHRQFQTLEQLCQGLQKRFFPLDRLERLAKQWLMLRQQAGVEEYREEFCLLQAAYPLGEQAEFMLAYHGLKPNMRAEVREALDEEEQEQLLCDKLFALAHKAEIRSFRDDHSHTATARDSFRGERKTTTQAGHRAGTSQARGYNQHSSRTSPPETRLSQTRKVNVDRASLLKEYPYWVCDQKGHFTRDCLAAKKYKGAPVAARPTYVERLSKAACKDSGCTTSISQRRRRSMSCNTRSRARKKR